MKQLRELLIRAVTGEAEEAERSRLVAQLEREPKLRAEYARLESLQGMLSSAEERSFGPFFAARVMHRIERERAGSTSMYHSLRWMFARVALAGLMVSIGLGVYNTVIAPNAELGSSAFESALGIPAENLETVYLLASE